MKIKSIYAAAYGVNNPKQTIDSSEKFIVVRKNDLDINSKPVAVIAPAVIALIIEAGKLLMSMMNSRKTEDALGNIGNWAEQIATELTRMNKLLEDIRQALSDLKIYIHQSFTRDNEFGVLGYCQTYIDNVDNFRNPGRDPNVPNEIAQFLLNFQQSVRKLMGYGFAPAFTISYAYMVEADLIKLAFIQNENKRKIAQQKTSATYSDYLGMCLDENLTGSYTQRLIELQGTIKQLEASYTSGNKGILIVQWLEVCHTHHDNESCSRTRHSWGYNINGDLLNGFSGEFYDGGTWDDGSASNYTDPTSANNHAQGLLNGTVTSYNSAAQLYRDSLQILTAVSKSIENLTAMREFIKN